MDPTTIECSTACTVTIVHELSLPPFQLSMEDGAAIAGAIVFVWTVGLAVRFAIRALNSDRGVGSDAPSEGG